MECYTTFYMTLEDCAYNNRHIPPDMEDNKVFLGGPDNPPVGEEQPTLPTDYTVTELPKIGEDLKTPSSESPAFKPNNPHLKP